MRLGRSIPFPREGCLSVGRELVRSARQITHPFSDLALVSSRLLHTIVGRTIVFTARMIVSYGEVRGTVKAQEQSRKGVWASVEERPREPGSVARRTCRTGWLPPDVHRATGTRREVAFTANVVQSVFYARGQVLGTDSADRAFRLNPEQQREAGLTQGQPVLYVNGLPNYPSRI